MRPLTLALLAGCALGGAPAPVLAAESFASPEGLEAEVTACLLKKGAPPRCMERMLGKRILPGNEKMVPMTRQLDDLLEKWLGGDAVYAVHPLKVQKTGDLFEKRTSMIEDARGALMVFEWSALKRLGSWYVFQFNLSSTDGDVKAALKGE